MLHRLTDKQNQTVVKFEEGLRLENHNSVMCTVQWQGLLSNKALTKIQMRTTMRRIMRKKPQSIARCPIIDQPLKTIGMSGKCYCNINGRSYKFLLTILTLLSNLITPFSLYALYWFLFIKTKKDLFQNIILYIFLLVSDLEA